MKHYSILLLSGLILAGCFAPAKKAESSKSGSRIYLLSSSYSDGTTPGIVVYAFDTLTGDFERVSQLSGIVNPSYMAISPCEKYVYSVNETSSGAVTSFAFNKDSGTLTPINSQKTEGADPCYINIDTAAQLLITANYSGGNLSVFPLHSSDGSIHPLSQNIAFADGSHIHTAVFSPGGKHLLVTDLGTDTIYLFRTASGNSQNPSGYSRSGATGLQKGSGPRHLAFHPSRRFLYCINELAGTVTVMDFDPNNGIGSIQQTVVSDTTPGVGGKGSADIHLSPDGRFLYASNRLKADGIAVFSVNPTNGHLTKAGYCQTGIHPRNFILSPNGKFLLCANRDSNNIQIFEIDRVTGLLHSTGKEIRQSRPVCLKWIGMQ